MPKKTSQSQRLFFRRSLTKKRPGICALVKRESEALVMLSFPEQNDPHYSKKIPLICSKFRFSDYISISKIHVSTVRIPLPDRKVLFDSFVKRKLRLPMSRGHFLFLEFFRIYSIKKKKMIDFFYLPPKKKTPFTFDGHDTGFP